LQTAIDNNHLRKEAKNDLLRHKFWTSLHCEKLKAQTRHKYDTVQNYDQLLREIRQVEKEISISSGGKLKESKSGDLSADVPKDRKVHSHVMTTGIDETEKRLSALERRLDAKVSGIESKMNDKFSKILEKLVLRGNYDKGYQGNGRRNYSGNKSAKQNVPKE
jgi:phage protein D